MSYKDKVKTFFQEANQHGYTREKIRRKLEHEFRVLASTDPEKFDEVAYAVMTSTGMKLKGVNNANH